MSATGSVNLIVCFSLSHPFAPPIAENLQRLLLHLALLPNYVLPSRDARILAAKDPGSPRESAAVFAGE